MFINEPRYISTFHGHEGVEYQWFPMDRMASQGLITRWAALPVLSTLPKFNIDPEQLPSQ